MRNLIFFTLIFFILGKCNAQIASSELAVSLDFASNTKNFEIPFGFPRELIFEADGQSLTIDSQSNFKKVIDLLLSNKDILLAIKGSGYHFGGREVNIAIGQKLANQVEGLLISSGVEKKRMEAVSTGKEKIISKRFTLDVNGDFKTDGQKPINIDALLFPFNSSLTASATQAPAPDPGKEERDRLAAELEASRKNAKDLEERLAVAQALTNNLPKPVAAASVRNAHALVIGNAAYPGSGRLDNPVNDANAISQKLRSMGFTVTTVTDANRQRLVQAMAQFRRSAASADLSLLFYSGHGVQIFGTNYILPTDVDQTDTAQATIQGVRLNEVIGNFMPGKTKIVFLDACRDNPLQRTGDRSVTKGLAPISVAEGTLISYATKDGQTAADGVGSKNSPFTQALLEHLSDPQDIGVVLRKVREKVMRATGGKQQPWEYGSLTGGELVLSAIKPK
jgi:hypothetical protein